MRCGYDALFRALGGTLSDFMGNLDFLHSVYMKTLYPKMSVPSFRVEELENDETILHYYSNRRGLGSMVYGNIRMRTQSHYYIGDQYFNWICF